MMKTVLLLDTSLSSCETFYDSFGEAEAVVVALRLLSFLRSRDLRDRQRSGSDRSSPAASPVNKYKITTGRQADKDDIHEVKTPEGSNFRWGFKFFSSSGSAVQKLPKKTSSFTNAWNEEAFRTFQKNAEVLFKNERNTSDKRKSLTYPSERLSTALTEILHDFEWKDKSDILKSPGPGCRMTKRISRGDVEVGVCPKDKENVVFIFANVPSSRQSLRRFSHKRVMDSDVFIDSFMSPVLQEEYKDKSRIHIYWINFSSDHDIDEETRYESLNIVQESLKKLGGNLLHKWDILRSFTSTATNSFNELHLPISILPSETSLQQLAKVVTDIPTEHIDKSVFVSGSSRLELIGANLTPSLDDNIVVSSNSNITKTHAAPSQRYSDDQSSLSLINGDIELQGYMPSTAVAGLVSHLEMHQPTVLTCDSNSKISFLLQMLIKSQHLAVLKISNREKDAPSQMALLTALTSTCGHIFLISWKQQLSLETSNFYEKSTSDTDSKTLKPATPFNSHVLNCWHMPGSAGPLACFIKHLKNSRNAHNDSSSVSDILSKVENLYVNSKGKEQPVPVTSTPISGKESTQPNNIPSSAESESGSASSQAQLRRGLSRRSSSSLSRGRLLVERARSANLMQAGDEECSNKSTSMSRVNSLAGRRTTGFAGYESLNIKSEEELLDNLQRQYREVLSAGVAIEASIQAMLTVTCHFMSTKESATNHQKSAITFIHQHLALDPANLRDKYGKSEDVDKKTQAVEYKLQVLLLMEMASLVPDNEDFQGGKLLNSLASMLRVLSFIIGPSGVREFMANTTNSHYGTLPLVLMEIHDELDLPYPSILAKLTSPGTPSTVWGLNNSVGSVDSFRSGPYSSQPSSCGQRLSQGTRRTSLKQHPSLTDFRQKKQILMEKPMTKPAVSKTEGKKSAMDKNKQKGKSRSKSAVDCNLAKRNLFTDKNKVKKAKEKVPLNPKAKSAKPKLLVPGTPARKQTSGRILSRQKRLRDHRNIKPEIQVVAESPVKDNEPDRHPENKPARYLLRESFYSTNSQPSRIVAKSMELEGKGERPATSPQRFLYPSGSHGSLISAVRGESPLLSPRSRMRKSFLASPSSGRKSSGQKKTTIISSTPPSSHVRRSPRKSVKKLLFHNVTTATNTNTTSSSTASHRSSREQQQEMTLLDARLVFDGENASDALLTSSPVKHSRIHGAVLKTPEKRAISKLCAWDHSSCPPFQVTPTKSKPQKETGNPELTFKNIFNNGPSTSGKSPEAHLVSGSPIKSVHNIHSSPLKHDTGYSFYKNSKTLSGGIKTGLKRSASDSVKLRRMEKDFAKLQRRISPQKAVGKGLSGSNRVSSITLKSPGRKSPSHHVSFTNSVSQSKTHVEDDGDIVLSTPQKTAYNVIHTSSHTTPSKVTFSAPFISPPTGSGRPVAVTPTRSILKGSPSMKNQSFVRRIQMTEESLNLTNKNCASSHNKNLLSDSPKKISKSLSFGQLTQNSVVQEPISLSSKSPLKKQNVQIMQLIVKRFDDDSSSCESSLSRNATQPSTIVITHTPSPSRRSKTPDSINKWNRKKSNSGSRTVLSSSSSSSSVSPLPNSNNSKEKVSGHETEKSQAFTIATHNLSSIAEGANLKRNLFSTNFSSFGSPPNKMAKSTRGDEKVPSIKISEENKEIGPIAKGKEEGKSSKLFSQISGGFSQNSEGVIQLQEGFVSGLDRKLSLSAVETISSSATTIQSGTTSYSCFSPVRSPSKRHRNRVSQQSSSFMNEGSQGFSLDLESHHDVQNSVPSPIINVEAPFEAKSEVSASSSVHKSSGDVKYTDNSPSVSKSTPVKKQQYSPALTTSGLLHLIRSPLLEETKANVTVTDTNNSNTSERRNTRSSRRHLNWPL